MKKDNVIIDFAQCPDDWPRVELGSVCDVVGGFATPKGGEPFVNGTIPFVRMKDLGRYHRTTNLVETRDRLNLGYITKHKLRIIGKGSILIPRSGSVCMHAPPSARAVYLQSERFNYNSVIDYM